MKGLPGRLGAASFAVLLAIASLLTARRDREGRERLAALVPAHLPGAEVAALRSTIAVAPAPDLAVSFLAVLAFEDATRPEEPSGARTDQRLEELVPLLVSAVADRPGWPYHAALLAEIEFARESRASSDPGERFLAPLRAARKRAPSDDALASFFALAALDLEGRVSPEAGVALTQVLERPAFLAATLPTLTSRLGAEEVLALLPRTAAASRAAFGILASQGDVKRAAAQLARYEALEREERDRALRAIEQRLSHGDVARARSLCETFVRERSIEDLDDTAGLAQLARLLELWPGGIEASWAGDPKGPLVRFFLDGREDELSPVALVATLDEITGVPRAIRARAGVRVGEAPELFAPVPETRETLEWAPVWLALASRKLDSGDREGARAALAHLPAVALTTCEARLVAERTAGQLPRTSLLTAEPVSARPDGTVFTLSACTAARGDTLLFELDAASEALVAWGEGTGRSGTRLVSAGRSRLRVDLPGRQGRRSVRVRVLAGGPVTVSLPDASAASPEASAAPSSTASASGIAGIEKLNSKSP